MTSFATEPIFDSNGTDRLDMDIGGVFDGGTQVNRAKFRKLRSGKRSGGGGLIDIAGDGARQEGGDM